MSEVTCQLAPQFEYKWRSEGNSVASSAPVDLRTAGRTETGATHSRHLTRRPRSPTHKLKNVSTNIFKCL